MGQGLYRLYHLYHFSRQLGEKEKSSKGFCAMWYVVHVVRVPVGRVLANRRCWGVRIPIAIRSLLRSLSGLLGADEGGQAGGLLVPTKDVGPKEFVMLYEVCSYSLGRLVASESYTCFSKALRAYQDWAFSLATDRVVIWEQANGELCEETPEATVIREAVVTDREDGSRVISLTFGV